MSQEKTRMTRNKKLKVAGAISALTLGSAGIGYLGGQIKSLGEIRDLENDLSQIRLNSINSIDPINTINQLAYDVSTRTGARSYLLNANEITSFSNNARNISDTMVDITRISTRKPYEVPFLRALGAVSQLNMIRKEGFSF